MARSGGTFAPGKSGNAKGRPPIVKHVIELARQHTDEAIDTLSRIMRDPSEKGAARVAAAQALLARGWGAPPVALELSGPDQGPIEFKGIDAPPQETRAQWEMRREQELHKAINGDMGGPTGATS